MKTQINLKSILILVLITMLSYSLAAQIKGNGNVIRKSRNVDAFNNIAVEDGIDVNIQQGSTQGIEVETDENLHEYLITEVSEGVLKIYFDKQVWNRKASIAYVTVTDLKLLRVSGGGDVKSSGNIKTGEIELSVSGGGDLDFDIESTNLNCNVSGGGDTKISTKAESIRIYISGGGDLDLGGEAGNVEGSVSGGGDADIALGASTGNVNLNVSGGGDLKLGTEAKDVSVSVSGGGDADITAGSNVNIAKVGVSGGGDLSIITKAKNLDIEVSGGGDLEAEGMADNLKAKVRDGSDMFAEELKVMNAIITLSGGSGAHLYVTGELEISASGGGDVYLTGNPKLKTIDLSGGSEIHNE